MYNCEDYLELLHNEVKPALGCTEPIAVALAVARARECFADIPVSAVEVAVSGNILKNAMGVGIPGTGMVGLKIAVALAVVCGKSEYGLEVLNDLTPADVCKAREFESKVTIRLADTTRKLYIEAHCRFEGGHSSKVVIADKHDAIVYVKSDETVVLDELTHSGDGDCGQNQKEISDYNLTLAKIYEFAVNVPLDRIEWLEEAVRLNKNLADGGLKGEYGLKVGHTIASESIFGEGLMAHCMALTAAASDARMAGCTLAAMSNSGSGNQGITVTMPVVAAAEKYGSSREELLRALALSHLVAIHIKGYVGRLSALCGCVIASTGAACGIVMLSGGTVGQMGCAVKNMIANISGMMCDGAKVGCALKVATGVACAVSSAALAMSNVSAGSNDGIVADDVEQTIANLGTIGKFGMQKTDEMILDIMINK